MKFAEILLTATLFSDLNIIYRCMSHNLSKDEGETCCIIENEHIHQLRDLKKNYPGSLL